MNNRFTKHFVLLIAVLLASVQSGLAATSYDYEEEIDGVTAYFTFNTNDRTLTLVELSDKNIESFNVPAKASNGLKITRVYFVTYSSLYSSLKSISIPNSVTALRLDYCTSLKSIKIPNSVTALRLSHCTSLTSVEIPNSVTGIGEKAFEYCTSLTSVEIPESVTEIGEKAFSGCTRLTSIVIPESVTKIGNGAFSGCTRLTSVEIPNSVTEIGAEAFSGCTSLTSIEIPNSVTAIGELAFSHCESLTSIVIPNSVTEIGYGAFSHCESLTSIVIPNSVTEIERYAFSGCTSLTSIEIPNSVTGIGEMAFSGCTSLTSIEIPNSVTKIGAEAFSGCINLSNIEIPQSVKSMDYRAFQNCKSLTSIFIPCDLYFYGGGVLLGGCENIESVTFSRRVSRFTYDGYYSYKNLFSDCPNLMSVKMYSAEPPDVQLTNYAFGKRDVMFVLYVPVGCKEKYKNYRVYYNKAVYYYPYKNYYIEEFDPDEDPLYQGDGIETIVSDDYDGVIDVYNMSGVKVLSTYNKDEIDNLPKGIYVVRAGQKPEKYIVK